MKRFGVRWAYFVAWDGTVQKMDNEALSRIYRSDSVMNVP